MVIEGYIVYLIFKRKKDVQSSVQILLDDKYIG